MRVIKIGTRGSKLALAQAKQVQKKLAARFSKCRFQLVIIKTTGDEYQSVELFKKTNVGVFTKALEKQLLSGKIDLAVHSLKDLPTKLPAGLMLAAYPKREDTRDVLISREQHSLESLPSGSVVGTGSPRRKRQLALFRPDLTLVDLRGNLDTRVKKALRGKAMDAIVLAKAGLKRLGKYEKYATDIPLDQLMTAVGQGILGVEARSSDAEAISMAHFLNDSQTQIQAETEREFLLTLGGGCRVPVGVNCEIRGRSLSLEASVFSTRNESFVRANALAPIKKHLSLARKLAKKLLKKGAARFLKEARS